jgi:hypothetical protein
MISDQNSHQDLIVFILQNNSSLVNKVDMWRHNEVIISGVILDQFYYLFVSMTLFHSHPHVKQAFDSTVNSTHCYMVLQDATCSHDIWKSYLRRRVNILVL